MRYSVADPSVLPPMPPVPDGIRLADLNEAGPEPVFDFDNQASLDEPGDVPSQLGPFEEWKRLYWGNPDHRPDLGVVAIAGRSANTANFSPELSKCRRARSSP